MGFTRTLRNGVTAIAALFAAMVTLAGCGGGSNEGGSADSSGIGTSAASRQIRGAASVTLQWPARGSAVASRLIPVAANSATVAFLNSDGAVVQSQLLVRPQAGSDAVLQTSATFMNLPAGSLSVAVSAYPSTDGSGVADAQRTTTVAIAAGQTTPVSLTLASTIAAVSISPNSLPSNTTTPTVLTATATDAANNTVVTSQWQWTSSNPSVFSIVPAGSTATIAPISAGSSTITATETESGKSASVTATAAPY